MSAALIEEIRAARRLPAPPLARAIRQAAGVSQERIATELGVHRLSVWRWEQGKRRPRGELATRYLALLELLRQEVEA